MKIIIGNIESQAIIGGVDNLLPFDLQKTLKKYLSMEIPGYRFTPAFKNSKGRWDGKKYFITDSGKFATGFLPAILTYMDELKVSVEIEDTRGSIPVMSLDNFDSSVGEWTLRENQEKAVKKVNNFIKWSGEPIYFPRGIVDAATNAGKNSIMAGIVNNFPDQMALMIINRESIYKQAVEFFSTIFPVGMIDSKNYTLNRFTVAMQQSLMNRASDSLNVRNDLGKFGILFADEAHFAGGKDYARLLSMVPAPIRILVSGTPLDTVNELNNYVIIGSSGIPIAKITNKELIDKGYSLKPKVHFLYNGVKAAEGNYPEQVKSAITLCEERMNEFKNAVIEEGWLDKQTLIAFEEIEHGNFMYESLINDERFKGIEIDIVHGLSKNREQKILDFKNSKTKILLGSTIMQEGLNIPDIEVLFFALAGKAKIPVKQFAGRLLRTNGVLTEGILVDFYDDCEWLDVHSRKRLKIYREEEFEIIFRYNADKLGRKKK